MKSELTIKPYGWQGSYARMRDSNGWPHDCGLCAEVRARWMAPDECLIIRSSEIVGYEKGYLYDDHFPPCEPDGRGKGYRHTAFRWDPQPAPHELSACCVVPGKGSFRLLFKAQEDFIDIELSVKNGMAVEMGNIDWHFCTVGFESPSLGDAEHTRTFLFDGRGLRSLFELEEGEFKLFNVEGGGSYVPPIFRSHKFAGFKAAASIILVESRAGTHAAAVCFSQSRFAFSSPVNRCFHADPCFPPIEKPGEERTIHGRFYLARGTGLELFDRYRRDFS